MSEKPRRKIRADTDAPVSRADLFELLHSGRAAILQIMKVVVALEQDERVKAEDMKEMLSRYSEFAEEVANLVFEPKEGD